jgi:hypothetical protein
MSQVFTMLRWHAGEFVGLTDAAWSIFVPQMATILNPTDDPSHDLDLKPCHFSGDVAAERRLPRAARAAEFWRSPAMRRRCKQGDSTVQLWKRYWKLKRPAPMASVCRSDGTPLSWGLNRQTLSPACAALLNAVGDGARGGRRRRLKEQRRPLHPILATWLDEARVTPPTWLLGIGCLAAAHLLGEAGGSLDAALGWETLDFLHATASQAELRRLDPDAEEDGLTEQLLAGELPWALPYYFSDMAPLGDLRAGARECLSAGLFELLNGEGLVRARDWESLPALLACWTRCCAIGTKFKKGIWSAPARKRYRAFVRQAVRWSDADARLLLAGESSDIWPRDMLRAALHFGGRAGDGVAARRLLGSRLAGKAKSDAKLPKPSYHCEWSSLGVLRSEWARESPILAVDYSRREMRVEVRAGRQRLFGGAWADQSHVDGRRLAAVGAWEELCWFSDKDVDYLEFVLPLEHGAHVERQILLGRVDEFMLLVDHLQNPEPADLGHAWELPLARGVKFQGEAETRDGLLLDGDANPLARSLPLALPEWRIDPRIGDLTMSDGRLRLAQQMHARAMACPLFIDLQRRRTTKPCTWRQLTVAESLVIQPADVAVGYRVQCGKDQWLFYRSQAPRANRTVLGQNTSSEFFAARFVSKTGGVEDLVEIEG